MQQSIKTRETQHKQNLCYTVTSCTVTEILTTTYDFEMRDVKFL